MRIVGKAGSRRLLVFCAVFSLITLCLLVLVPLQLATAALGKEATGRVAATSSVSANSIQQQMNGLTELVDAYAHRGDVTTGLTGNLQELQHANPDIRNTLYLDADGKLVGFQSTSNPVPSTSNNLGGDFSYRDYFTGAMHSSGPYVSETYIGKSSAAPKVVAISEAVRDGSGNLLGVLVANIDVTPTFQHYVDDFARDHGVDLEVDDQRGNMVAYPGLGKQIIGHGAISHAGELSAASSVGGTRWTVVASVSKKAALAPIRRLRFNVLLIASGLGVVVIGGLLALYHSLRGREQAEQSLRLSELRTRSIIDTAAQAFIEIDAQGRVTEWNQHAALTFGWTRSEVLGSSLEETIIPPHMLERTAKFLSHLLTDVPDQPEHVRYEGLARSRNCDTLMPVECTIWKTVVMGAPRLNFFIYDISDRKRLEDEQELIVKRQRRLVEELRQADKAKADFVSLVSHELRTPLTSIVGYLEMLREGYGGELADQQVSMLNVVDRNSRRLLGLIEDLLTLSRVESGAYKVSNMPVDLAALVYSAREALLPSALERSIDLKVDIDTPGCTVSGDPGQLERVLLNLLSNAIKFTPEGGHVAVRVEREGNTVRLRVSDTGIGIPLDEQGKLFNRFFRASTAQERAIQGTGLGLTIVKTIVERHGGTITVESVPDKGTTMTAEFPIGGFTAQAAYPAPTQPAYA